MSLYSINCTLTSDYISCFSTEVPRRGRAGFASSASAVPRGSAGEVTMVEMRAPQSVVKFRRIVMVEY